MSVIRSKLVPPQPPARLYCRARVLSALQAALEHRVTILQAGAGYGKSTALVQLAQSQPTAAWYTLGKEDADPLVFLLHLTHSLQRVLPDAPWPLPLLEHWTPAQGPLPAREVVDRLLNTLAEQPGPVLLILDDVHRALRPEGEVTALLNRLIDLAPPQAHFVLASRFLVTLPDLPRWLARGEVLTLDQHLLAFREEEIAHLFAEHYGFPLEPEEVALLSRMTEGWAIALHLVWQALRTGAIAGVSQAFEQADAPLEHLFTILAHEVLAGQPEDIRHFLIQAATLRRLDPGACAAVTGRQDIADLLSYLEQHDLFVVKQEDGTLRFHFIVHRFLRHQASEEARQRWHLRAADHYAGQEEWDEALYHYLKAGAFDEAARALEVHGERLLAQGRLDTLAAYLAALPPEVLHEHPALLSYLGEIARLRSRFAEALAWHQQAEALARERGLRREVLRALYGQVRVYLDTVNPAGAEELLQQALRLSDGVADREALARLYELLAENKLNAGQPEEAERLRLQAEHLRASGPSDSQLLFRVLLRTGRLAEARRRLEARAQEERQHPVQTPRAHRETLLLLSLIYAFLGEGEAALRTAQEGTRRGEALDAPYVTAVGHMRQGHALMLLPDGPRYAEAIRHYDRAVEVSHALAVPRLRVEACWGLARAYGYTGALEQAVAVAEEGLRIASEAGDPWIASLVHLALGASFALAHRWAQARQRLQQAARGFAESGDPFGHTAAHLWLGLVGLRSGSPPLEASLGVALRQAREHGYDFLFLRPTLLGPPDERLFVPLLIAARDQGIEGAYAAHLLEALGLPRIQCHPGYMLRVFTLGAFRVFRGTEEITPEGWRREKSRQLFQLLLAHRHTALEREQILDALWPDQPLEAALRNFKVALSVLYNVLEPDRPPGSPSAYIVREGSTYRLRPEADLWLDAAAFERLAASPRAADLEQALRLYQGDFLPDARYEAWAAAERERLAVLHMQAADALCRTYLREKRYEEVIPVAERLLAQDNCWERAYRYLMEAFAALGDLGQVARTYHRCRETLAAELGVPPDPETEALYWRLIERPEAAS